MESSHIINCTGQVVQPLQLLLDEDGLMVLLYQGGGRSSTIRKRILFLILIIGSWFRHRRRLDDVDTLPLVFVVTFDPPLLLLVEYHQL